MITNSSRKNNGSRLINDRHTIENFNSDPLNTYFVSFPRTGSHWMRMVMELYFERPSLTRVFYYPENTNYLTLHTHDMELDVLRDSIIYLYRDPVATVYSQLNYYYEPVNDLERILYWSESYANHLYKWLCKENFTRHKTVLVYERLKENLAFEFSKITSHFGMRLDEKRLADAAWQVSKEEVKRKTHHDEQVIQLSISYEQARRDFLAKYGNIIMATVLNGRDELKPFMDATRTTADDHGHNYSATFVPALKIVGLVHARNEQNIIAQCLKALSLYTDAIVFLDDASTDDTVERVREIRKECRVERIITKERWLRDEPGDRNALLTAGREIGGTHFIQLDADEMFTSNLLDNNHLRDRILELQPGDALALTLIQLWRGVNSYRLDSSQWSNDNRPFIFCDDKNCYYASDFIHTKRVPENLKGTTYRIEGYEYGVMHFQFVNWENLLIKQAWYRCLEHIRQPQKPINEINRRYAPSKDETGIHLEPSPSNWFAGYPFFNPGVFNIPEKWRKKQVNEWFQIHGTEFFRELDIWDVEWNGKTARMNMTQRISSTAGLPRITLVTPSYNQGAFIEKTITSVLDQNYPNLEYIIIDGGSTDKTVDILKKYSDRLTYWCSEPDNGQSDAINKGIARATGQIFNWLCSDDYLEPGALFKVSDAYQKAPQAAGWVGGCRWVDSNYRETWVFYPHSLDVENFVQNFNGKQLSQPSCFLNTVTLREVGGVNPTFTYAMDFDLWSRMLQRGGFRIGGGIWANYYFHSEAKTIKNREHSYLEASNVQNKLGYPDAAEKRYGYFKGGEKDFWPLIIPDKMEREFSAITETVDTIYRFRTDKNKILFISTNVPSPENHAADKRICLMLRILLENDCDIHFAYLTENHKDRQFAQEFGGRITFYRTVDHDNFEAPDIFLSLIESLNPDTVIITNCWWLQFCLLMTRLLIRAQQAQLRTRFVVDTMDFHHKHYTRKYAVSRNPEDLREAEKFLLVEDELYSRADCVVVVTDEEKRDILDTLKKPITEIRSIPTIHDIVDRELLSVVPMEKRFCNICFVGNFGAMHNVDAVRFFIREIFPLILQRFPETGYPDPEFHVIGINLEPYRQEFESRHVKVIGFVEDLQALLTGDRYKVMACPLVYGSGIKGKIGDAACAGLPFVTTSIGAEGFLVSDGVDCFIADDPSEFASKCIQLMTDNVIWHNFSIRSRIMVHNNYSLYAVSQKMRAIIEGRGEMDQTSGSSGLRYEQILAIKEQASRLTASNAAPLSVRPNPEQIKLILNQIETLPSDWHKAGTLDASVLAAFVKHASNLPLEHSLETGSGKSTLMFSNISRHHLVFALDAGDSITCVKNSPLFNRSAVEYVEGPTQTTLPYYRFRHKLDFALIDGPHGYPFPEMEYYFIYPHLKEGAILVIDDIHIPTIFNLFKFLMDDSMFEFLEIVNQTTAFFRRTSSPLFSPTGDGWWEQEYNKKNFPESMLNDELRKLLGR